MSTKMKEPVEFVVMAQQGIGIDQLRRTLESQIGGLEFKRTIPAFRTVVYMAEREVFENLERTYESQYADIVAAMQRNEIKLSY